MMMKKTLGKTSIVIGGEIVTKGDSVHLTIRIKSTKNNRILSLRNIKGAIAQIDSILNQGAEYILEQVNPVMYLHYIVSVDKMRALREIEYYLEQEDKVNASVLYNMWGTILVEEKKYEDAINKFQKALDCCNEAIFCYQASMHIGLSYREIGNTPMAISYLEDAINIYPENAMAYTNLGFILFNKEDPDSSGAVKMFKEAIKNDSTFAMAYFGWGLVVSKPDDCIGAIEKYKRAIKFDPDILGAYLELGACFSVIGEYQDACRIFEKAIKIDSSEIVSEIYYWWAGALVKLENYDQAEAKLRKSIEINPNYKEAYYALGKILIEKVEPNYQEAYIQFEKAVKLDISYVNAYFGMGMALEKQGKYALAKEKFKKVIELDLNGSIGEKAKKHILFMNADSHE